MKNRRTVNAVFLVIYLLTVLWYTVLHRSSGFHTAQFELFWSYRKWFQGDLYLGWEILANMAMFIPFGFLLSSVLPERRFIIPSAAVFSLMIESLQLFMMRGLFEWDDVFSNTVGSAVGMMLFAMIGKRISEQYRSGVITVVAACIMFVCLGVVVRGYGTDEEADSTSRAYCFQIDESEVSDGRLTLSGFAFRYEHPDSDFSLILRSDDEEVRLLKVKRSRADVNNYFSCDYDYTDSGFTATGEIGDGEYEVFIKWPWSIALSTGVFVSSSDVHYADEDEFAAPELDADFVKDGILRVYRPDYHCWVYQKDWSLYWVVDEDFCFEDDGSTYIQYQLWTTQTDRLPQHRLDHNWLWDNIGGNFEDYEILGDFGEYRVMKREIPSEYAVTSIVTGYHKDGRWIWKNYFRPIYKF